MKTVEKEEFWVDWCKEELAQGRSLKIPAHGFSMLPSIIQGSIVQIEAISMEQILPGDLIAFQRLQHIVVHRVLKIKQKYEIQITRSRRIFAHFAMHKSD